VPVGLAFNTKMLAAAIVVPGLALGHAPFAPVAWRRRIVWLLLAGVVIGRGLRGVDRGSRPHAGEPAALRDGRDVRCQPPPGLLRSYRAALMAPKKSVQLSGVVVAQSSVSSIDPDEGVLMYRGYDIAELAEHSTYEEVAYLLLYGELPSGDELDAFRERLAERELPEHVAAPRWMLWSCGASLWA